MTEHPTPTPPAPSSAPRPQRLGEVLQEARKAKGLELSDIAQSTHVRKEYLKALDEGRYQDLPEDVYAKNFLRLYGQAVGLESAKLLELYQRERHGQAAVTPEAAPQGSTQPAAAGTTAPTAVSARAEAAPKAPTQSAKAPRERRSALPRRPSQLGGLLSSLLLVGLLVWGALWAFNNLLFPPSPTSAATPPPSATETAQPAAEPTPPAATGTVFFSLTSEPPGAEVSLDNFVFPTPTPIVNAPVTPSESRTLRVSMDGFETFEREIDLSFDRNLSVALTPLAAAAPEGETVAAQADAEATAAPPAAGAEGQIALTILAESWLEAYAGTSRGQGQPLLYRTVRAGETFTFNLPVYLHIGNGGGVRYAIGGQDRGLMGSSGEVVSRAFTAP
jgi:cytoskeleton protein RodZ